jgi:hypothetical protein
MPSKWLDESTHLPLIDEKAEKLESFTAAVADGVIDSQEIEGQLKRVVAAMEAVEGDLDEATHAKVTTLLVELTAYNIMRSLHEIGAARARAMFSD